MPIRLLSDFDYWMIDFVGKAHATNLGYSKPALRLNERSLDSDFKCNTMVSVVGTDSRIKHLAFRSQVFFLAGGSTHLEPCVSPDR